MILLDLFSGTQSLRPVAESLGYEYISLDIDPSTNPSICSDILEWDYESSTIKPDIIWGSPECKWFSKLTSSNKKYSTEDIEKGMIEGDKLVMKVFEIIEYFNPTKWFLENPFTGRLKGRDIMKDKKYYRTDYCCWGMTYKKPTAIWTNIIWNDCKKCNPKTCEMVIIDYDRPNNSNNLGYYYNHKSNLGGVKTKLTKPNSTLGNDKQKLLRYKIPEKLLYSLISQYNPS
jgi:hypothetical protein